MTQRRKLVIVGIICVLVIAYASLCYLAFSRKPSVTFEGAVPDEARNAIVEWFHNDDKFTSQRPSLENILYAMAHPLSPPREQIIVDDENFGGGMTASYRGYLISFEEIEGNWVLSECINVLEEMSFPNKPRHLMVESTYRTVLSADQKDHEAIISWRFQRNGEGEREYLDGGAAMRFYWNDAFVGVGSVGLAEVYDKLKSFKGRSVKFVSRPRVPEDDKYLNGPIYSDNPLERDDAFVHFYQLLRKKNVNFTIEFKDDPTEPRYGGPNYNPFREEK